MNGKQMVVSLVAACGLYAMGWHMRGRRISNNLEIYNRGVQKGKETNSDKEEKTEA